MSSSFIGISPNPINRYNFIQWFPVQNLTLPLSEAIPLPQLNHAQQISFAYKQLPKLSDRKFRLRIYPVPFVRNEPYTIYINSNNPFDNISLPFSDLRLAVLQGTTITQDTTSPLEKDDFGSDKYRVLIRNFLINSVPTKGYARLMLYRNSNDEIKYISNPIEIYEENECSLTAILQYSAPLDEYRFHYATGTLTNWSNKIRVHVVDRAIRFEGTQEVYKSVNTGSNRISGPEDDLLREIETQFFDENAHEAFHVALKHSEHGSFFINSKAYIQQSSYNPNSNADFPLTKGTVNVIEQDYAVDRRGGVYEAPPAFFLTSRTARTGNITLDLDNKTIEEGQPVHTKVGDFLYSGHELPVIIDLEPGFGDTDNNSFRVCPDCMTLQLQSLEVFDASVKDEYSIRVKIVDIRGFSTTEVFIISVNATPNEITDITLDNNQIEENKPAGTLIGTFSTTGGTGPYAYALVQGPEFNLIGDKLYSKQSYDYETKNAYTISVRSTDSLGATFIKTFIVQILDVDESVSFTLNLDNQSIEEGQLPQPIANIIATGGIPPYTFALADDGTGGWDFFVIQGDVLFSAAIFDYDDQNSYSFDIILTDALLRTYRKNFVINILDVGVSIDNIVLSGNTIDEGKPAGTQIGLFSAVGGTPPFVWSLPAGAVDNSLFTVGVGAANVLKSAVEFDFEDQQQHRIRVSVRDSRNETFTKDFTIFVNDLNELGNITLTKNHFCEDVEIGTVVGNFLTFGGTPPYSYSFVSGEGDQNNNKFAIFGDQFLTADVFNYSVSTQHSIRVRATDSLGGAFEKAFIIYVDNVIFVDVQVDTWIDSSQPDTVKPSGLTTLQIANTSFNELMVLFFFPFFGLGINREDIIEAHLELVGRLEQINIGDGIGRVSVMSPFNQNTITWNKVRGSNPSSPILIFGETVQITKDPTVPGESFNSLNVTSQVKWAVQLLFDTVYLILSKVNRDNTGALFASREDADPNDRPRLKLCLANPDNTGESNVIFSKVYSPAYG